MFSKEFMTYLLSIDSENTPKKEDTIKEISFKKTTCTKPVAVDIRIK